MQYFWEKNKKAKITFSGDRPPANESALIISNHTSWADFYPIHAVAIRRGMLHRCRYFAKDSLKWLPFFGWAMILTGMIMVKRNWTQDSGKINAAFATLRKEKRPVWLVSYLEGTRITAKKLAESKKFAESRNKPVLNNVLYPRTKGFVASVQGLRGSHVKHVYDFTLAYEGKEGFQAPPDLIKIYATPKISPPYKYHVHVRRFAIEDLPSDDAGLHKWVEKLFVEKDEILQGLKDKWTNSDKVGIFWDEPYW